VTVGGGTNAQRGQVETVPAFAYLDRVITAYLVLFLLTAIWGLTFPLVQIALADASPLVFLTLRFSLAAVVFPLLMWPRAFRLSSEVVWRGLGLGIFLWSGFAFQTFGLAHTTAARSGFLTGTLVPLTPLFSWLLFRTRIALRVWIAVGLAFAGTAIMSNPGEGGLNIGDVLTLLCAICFALQVVLVGRWGKREHVAPLNWLQILATALLSLICIPFAPSHLNLSSPTLLWAVGITAVLATAFALWGQLRFQPRISATSAAIIYAIEPMFAALAAWIMLGTVPGRTTLIGALFIITGMILASTTPTATIREHP
jgi:drug/metabolite transporter (DMT)-like permease